MSGRLAVLVIAGSFYISSNVETFGIVGQGPAVLCWRLLLDGRTGLHFSLIYHVVHFLGDRSI